MIFFVCTVSLIVSINVQDHHLSPPDTLELADQLIKRAASLPSENFPMLQADKLEIVDLLFNLSAYHHPDNINLPSGYVFIFWVMLFSLCLLFSMKKYYNLYWKRYAFNFI